MSKSGSDMTTKTTLRTVTIVLPEGYRDAEEFCKDCGFEQVADGNMISSRKAYEVFTGRKNDD
jgi:hypothetical protein